MSPADQIGNLALLSTLYQNGCYTDGRYNHKNYLVKRGVLKNSSKETLVAVTHDSAGHLYYFTVQAGSGVPGTSRTAKLYKCQSNGAAIASRTMDCSKTGFNMVEFSKSASLKFSKGNFGLMFGRTMHQSGDGLNHQGGIAVVFDAATLQVLANHGQTSGHSCGNFLIVNSQNEFTGIDLGDNYPRGINLVTAA